MSTEGNTKNQFTPQEAVEYLKKKWDLPSYSVNAFRQYRHRLKIRPTVAPELPNASLWTKAELDALPRPDSSRRRNQHQRESDTDKEVDKANTAMLSLA